MVAEIRIYVEGGGDQRSGKAVVREGFSKFLYPLREMARQGKIRWSIIACGGRQAAFDNFQIALRQHADAFNVLLVDAEGPVCDSPWVHLQQCDGWRVTGLPDDHCHLMVQTVEAWLIADPDALEEFYGQGFNRNSIPRVDDVERVSKADLESGLKQATRNTQKGEYHKVRHGPKILALLNTDQVRMRARHCERFFSVVAEMIKRTAL